MKKLDLVKINSCAPYAVKEDTQEGAYTFIADSGAEFSIGFMPDDLIQSDKYRNRYTMVTSTLLDEYGIDNVASVMAGKSIVEAELVRADGNRIQGRAMPVRTP